MLNWDDKDGQCTFLNCRRTLDVFYLYHTFSCWAQIKGLAYCRGLLLCGSLCVLKVSLWHDLHWGGTRSMQKRMPLTFGTTFLKSLKNLETLVCFTRLKTLDGQGWEG